MPAKSIKQRRMMAIAEHNPGALYERNRDVGKIKKSVLHEYAATREEGLPKRKK